MFAFRLALAMGIVDVDAMLAAMPVGLIREWEAFYDAEPWGHPIADTRHADLCGMWGARPSTVMHKPKHRPRPSQRPLTGAEVAAKMAEIRGHMATGHTAT